jgi:hypothetical protein
MGYDLEDKVLFIICAIGAFVVLLDVFIWRNV